MKEFLLAVAFFATIAISSAVDEECIQRKMRGLPVHWPNPTNCASFYRCTNKNIKRELLCPDGKIYNMKTGRCANQARKPCQLSLIEPLARVADNTCEHQLSGTFASDPSSCRAFFICNNNLSYPQTCDLGSYFNKEISACEPDTKTVCWENLCANKSDATFVVNANDCHSFYICNEGKPVAQQCPNSSYFNAENLNCQPGNCQSEQTTTTISLETTTTTRSSTQKTAITTCAPELTTTTCATEPTTTTCAPQTTTTTCAPQTTTTACATETTTTTCIPETTTTTSTTETTTTSAPETATTTSTTETTIGTSTTESTTTTCAPQTTTTTCATETTTTTCSTTTTTPTCTPEITTTTCAPETSTTTCFPETTTTPSSNLYCDSSRCQNEKNNYVFPAKNTNAGFCLCLNQKVEYRMCPDESIFNKFLQICVVQDKVCPSTKCAKDIDYITFPATNTTTGFCRCLGGQATFNECDGANQIYNNTLGFCEEKTTKTMKMCKGGYSEGDFVANPDNCMFLYICYKGELEEISCGSGNYFDYSIKACMSDTEGKCPESHQNEEFVNSRRTKRSLRDSRCIEGFKTPTADCDKYFKCNSGHRLLYGCGKNNFFNSTSLACQLDVNHVCWPANSCTEGEKTASSEDNTRYYECVNGRLELRSCGLDSYFNKPKQGCILKQECTCPGGYKDGQVSAHPTDFDKFYLCVNGEQKLQKCGLGNYFDKECLSCKRDVNSTYQTSCGTNNYFNNDSLTCEPNLCAGKPNGTLIANPQQCNAFFLCSNEEPTGGVCHEGQWFDPSTSACVVDVKAVCYNPCADENSGSIVLLQHPICNEYYFCNGKKTFVGTCLVGSFDNETGVCNENKKCFPNPCDNPVVTVFADPYDPAKFYWCNSQKQPIQYTCPEGKLFDNEYKICRKVSNPECPVCAEDGALPTLNGTDNTEFCVCVDGVSTKLQCPNQYVFNRELGVCYSNAACDPGFCLDAPEYATFPNRNCSNSFCMCVDKQPVIVKCPNNGKFNPYTLECSNYTMSPECLQATCVNKTSNTHIFAPINPRIDNGFCQCINHIATFKHCLPGTTINPTLLICQLDDMNCNSYQCRGLPNNSIIPAETREGYCECIGGVATYHKCPDNNDFNVTSYKCEPAVCDLSKCIDEESFEKPFPASVSHGFCLCDRGFVECPLQNTLYSEIYLNCLEPCPQVLCKGKPDNYLVSSLINNSSFCMCHSTPIMTAMYEVCSSKSFTFNEAQQICLPDVKELCGHNDCKDVGAFEAKDTLTGFCLCTEVGGEAIFQKCLEGMFVLDKKACLPRPQDVCEVSLCAQATFERPITLPANNSILAFCYCSSPNDAMLLPCPNGKYYNPNKGMCVNEQEENCSCPNNIAEGEKVADSTSCNKYSICVNGVMESRTCPDGDYFNVDEKCCIRDIERICHKQSACTCLGIYYEKERLPHPVNSQMYYICQDNSLHEHKCPTGRIFSAAQRQCITKANLRHKRSTAVSNDLEFGCLENEKRSVPSNCSQYEICLQKSWVRRICSNYRYYNPEQKKCLEPQDDFVCPYAKITSLPICNASLEYSLLKAKSCKHYYRCQAGKWRLSACRRHQYFSPQVSSCLPIPKDSFLKCELLTNSADEKDIASSCQHLSQRFYSQNCAMYLICLDNDWWYQYCPRGMHYNRSLNYCVHDADKQCKDVMLTKVGHKETFSQDSCQQDGFLRPSALACNRYFVCVNGKWQMQHCSAGEFYDVGNSKCSLDTEGMCIDLNKDCLPNQRKSVPQNCSMYEQCSLEGEWLKRTCSHDEIFDDLLQECTNNQGVCSQHGLRRSCRQNETLAVEKNCSMFYYCSLDTWHLGSCLKGFMYSAEKNMCVSHMPEDSCKPLILYETEQSAISVSNPCQDKLDGSWVASTTDCTRYYICNRQSITQEMQCTRGSYFDGIFGFCRPNDGRCRLPLSGACINASDESLLPHPSDCQAFYSCSTINGSQLLHCESGQYFDNHIHQCRIDHGECKKDIAYLKQKCFNLSHGSRLPHEIHCNIYYVCINGLAISVECPVNYRFDKILSECILDNETKCQGSHLLEGNPTYNCVNYSNGTWLADPKDCTRYYICLEGEALPEKCQSGSYFNGEELLCVPDDGFCPFVNKIEAQHNNSPPDPVICEGRHGFLISDPANCNNFYICIHNKLKHERCHSQQFFNTTSHQCERSLLQENHLNYNATNINANFKTAQKIRIPQCLNETTTVKQICSEVRGGTSFAEPDDCRRYIACQVSGDEPISLRCRNGESFDSILGFCRQNDGTCLLENGQRVGECSGKHGQLAADPNNCRNYYVCINGQKITQTCKDNEYFSKTQNMCTKDTLQVCKPTEKPTIENQVIQSCEGLSDSILYPYIHDNCRSYFQCIKGVLKVHQCADDLYFAPLAIKCTKNKTECIMPTQILQRSPPLRQTYNKLCFNKKMELPYANVDNRCRSFYFCHANGQVSHELCPLGTIFNREQKVCTDENKTSCP